MRRRALAPVAFHYPGNKFQTMTALSQLIPIAINASIFTMVFALGAKTERGDAVYIFDHKGLLIRSILSMNVVMVLVAALIAAAFDLAEAIEVALIAIAISPVPPVLPGKQIKAGGTASYAISLLVAASVASIVIAPLAVSSVGFLFGRQTVAGIGRLSSIIIVSILLPLFLGIALRIYMPAVAARIAPVLSRAGTVLLILAVLPVLVTATATIWEFVGNGVLAVLIGFSLIGLVVGHMLGGPETGNRTVLALATSTRHPGVAMAIAGANAPGEKALLSVILFHLVVGAIVALPYMRLWTGSSEEPSQ
ncbi:MAG: Na+-dependent transporter [Rhizobiaceae bacterium]|nr:Na+-dependent transporter [Rhizobiaceae bacterium]